MGYGKLIDLRPSRPLDIITRGAAFLLIPSGSLLSLTTGWISEIGYKLQLQPFKQKSLQTLFLEQSCSFIHFSNHLELRTNSVSNQSVSVIGRNNRTFRPSHRYVP